RRRPPRSTWPASFARCGDCLERVCAHSARATSPYSVAAARTQLAPTSRMPLYTYECHSCGNRFVEVMSIDDHEKRKLQCPRCRSQDTEPMIEAAHVVTARKS